MRHFLTTEDWAQADLQRLLDRAQALKRAPIQDALRNRAVALLFLNSSLRTRTSFQLGVHQLGGLAIVLQPGKDAWPLEFNAGTVMDGEAEEHIAEVARVLSRYCDLIALRAFPKFQDWAYDRTDPLIRALARWATVPVINMETIVHPCQELAHLLTLQERLGDVRGRKYLLTWCWHPRPLNTAVANSALLIATKFGMDVTLLCPDPAYLLDERFLQAARQNAATYGGSVTVTHDIDSAYRGAEIVYAKSWGALVDYGRPEAEWNRRKALRHFIVDERKMGLTDGALFSHCLPLRRNVKATDGVMDSDDCVAIDEAENRLHVQKSVMVELIEQAVPRAAP